MEPSPFILTAVETLWNRQSTPEQTTITLSRTTLLQFALRVAESAYQAERQRQREQLKQVFDTVRQRALTRMHTLEMPQTEVL